MKSNLTQMLLNSAEKDFIVLKNGWICTIISRWDHKYDGYPIFGLGPDGINSFWNMDGHIKTDNGVDFHDFDIVAVIPRNDICFTAGIDKLTQHLHINDFVVLDSDCELYKVIDTDAIEWNSCPIIIRDFSDSSRYHYPASGKFQDDTTMNDIIGYIPVELVEKYINFCNKEETGEIIKNETETSKIILMVALPISFSDLSVYAKLVPEGTIISEKIVDGQKYLAFSI